jgi:preprotein translocase subunit SecF
VVKGLNYGVDFRGGAEIQVKFDAKVESTTLRTALVKSGLTDASVQTIGEEQNNEFLIKVQADQGNLNEVTDRVSKALANDFKNEGVTIRKTDIVGPKAGDELKMSGYKAMFYAILAIMIYIGLRFDFKYAPGAIIALAHDVTITLGLWSLLNVEFTLQIVAALLMIIGYSVNDTVVIYDRVREYEDKNPELSLLSIINLAINETLSRTVLTSGTTLFTSMALWFWGGESIRDFFFAFSFGIIVGTYSSVFIAAPITIFFDRLKRNRSHAIAS